MYFEPFIIGIASFFIIGLFHPIVIKTEYYFSHKVWPVFLVFGLLCTVVTLVFYWNIIINTVIALACLIVEHQRAFRTERKGRKGLVSEKPQAKGTLFHL